MFHSVVPDRMIAAAAVAVECDQMVMVVVVVHLVVHFYDDSDGTIYKWHQRNITFRSE